MSKFTRTIKTTTYICKVYNYVTDALEIAVFTAEGTPVTGRKLAKLVETESNFRALNLQFLHVVDTDTTEKKYWCTLSEFLSVAHAIDEKDDESDAENE